MRPVDSYKQHLVIRVLTLASGVSNLMLDLAFLSINCTSLDTVQRRAQSFNTHAQDIVDKLKGPHTNVHQWQFKADIDNFFGNVKYELVEHALNW